MSENHSLEDLINNDARAYQFYFDQTPRVQTLLQMKDIRSFAEMAKIYAFLLYVLRYYLNKHRVKKVVEIKFFAFLP